MKVIQFSFFALFFLISCSDTVIDPFENEDKYFTVWGYIDQLETEHTVRVIAVTRFAEDIVDASQGQATIDAEVYSTDLTSGVRTKWFHRLAQLQDGSLGHVFTGRFIVRPKRTYRLEVIRSDGKMAVAETRVPAVIGDTLLVKGPEVWENDSTTVYQEYLLPGIASPWEIQAIYLWSSPWVNRRIFVAYDRQGERTEDGGWRIKFNISDDQEIVRADIERSFSTGQQPAGQPFGLTAIGIQFRILDKNWDPPNGVFDPEILAQPGVLSNVENGHGFFGSIGVYREEWNASHMSRALGYPF